MTPKPMKPVKAWALVDVRDGKIDRFVYENYGLCVFRNKRSALEIVCKGQHIARVVITEVER